MGAILIQLIPHNFKDVGEKENVKSFLQSSCAAIKKKTEKEARCGIPQQAGQDNYWYGSIYFSDDAFGGLAPLIYLRKDFWQLEYPCHYPYIMMKHEGELLVRNLCAKLAQALGAAYSHYCDEYFVTAFENINDSFEDLMNQAQQEGVALYNADYYLKRIWSDVKDDYPHHFDDYYK